MFTDAQIVTLILVGALGHVMALFVTVRRRPS